MKVGRNVTISPKASLYGADNIEIGDNVRIDDFCILSGGSGLRIGSHIHIAAYVSMFAGSGITIGDFCQFGAYTILLSESDDFSGESLIGPCIPMEYKPFYKSGKRMIIERHVVFGSRCTVFPGVYLGEGAAFGAGSVVTSSKDPWQIYAGTPARAIKPRNRAMIELGKRVAAEWGE